jgi:putative tryptophan/tyrosine transport system substrate-binding protein
MRRREFITLLSGAAVAWPLAARAQQPGVARVGFLGSVSAAGYASRLEALRAGLRDFGYVEGRNLIIETRWAEGNYDRLPGLVAELLELRVDAIVTHATPGTLAAKRATTIVPIVMALGNDPVETGLVASLARPGGNVTGSAFFIPQLAAKNLELLKEAVPSVSQAAVLINARNPAQLLDIREMDLAAKTLKIELHQFRVESTSEFELAFAAMLEKRVDAVAILEDPVFNEAARRLGDLATKLRLSSTGPKVFAEAGGLLGYGVNVLSLYYRAAYFVDRILKGTKPTDLPIEQATKFELVVNLKTAKALGLTISESFLLRADEVID